MHYFKPDHQSDHEDADSVHEKKHRRKHRTRYNYSRVNTNDLSYYYSLTDVKYYNIDDDEDEVDANNNTNSMSRVEPMVKTHSLTSLASIESEANNLSACTTTSDSSTDESRDNNSCLSLKSDTILKQRKKSKYEAIDSKLQKSITLPNANEISSYCLGLGISTRPAKSDTESETSPRHKHKQNDDSYSSSVNLSFSNTSTSSASSSLIQNATSRSQNLVAQKRQQQEQRKKRFFYLNTGLGNAKKTNSLAML